MAKRGSNLVTYTSVGYCIYCSKPRKETKLTEEHIIPFGINGNLVLPDSSCIPCAEHINKNGENPLLRDNFGILRAKLGTWTRNKKHRDKVFECYLRNDRTGKMQREEIPIEDYPLQSMLVLKEPGLISGDMNRDGMNELRMVVVPLPNHILIAPDYSLGTRMRIMVGALELALAKIAYSYCFAIGKLNRTYIKLLPDVIRGVSPYIWNYVGGFDNEESETIRNMPPAYESFNKIWVMSKIIGNKEYLVCAIQLFSHLRTPLYQVIVGEKQNP